MSSISYGIHPGLFAFMSRNDFPHSTPVEKGSCSIVTVEQIECGTIQALLKRGPPIASLLLPPVRESGEAPVAYAKVFSKKTGNYAALSLYSTGREVIHKEEIKLSFALKDDDTTVGILTLMLKVDHIFVCWIENLRQDLYGDVGMSLMHFTYTLSLNKPYFGKIRGCCLTDNFDFFAKWGASEYIDYEMQETIGYSESHQFVLSKNAIVTKNKVRDYATAILYRHESRFPSREALFLHLKG